MKSFVKIFIVVAAVCAAVSCKNSGKSLLPNVAGKAGEVLVVLEKGYWDTGLGNDVRDVLARPCEYLPQREPLYSLVDISPGTFTDMFKYHRNILIFNIDPSVQKQGIVYRNDVWAHPQCVIQVNASNADSAAVVFSENGEIITSTLEQAERNRIIANNIQYEEKELCPEVEQVVGGKLHFPYGYELKKKTSNFLWFEDERQYTLQGIFVYKYPVDPKDTTVFNVKNIVAKRNEFLKENVPMEFVETRGLWEVFNDYMGGPFVSHSFYSQDGKEIIVLEAWVYAAKYDKRQYLRQTESILYSFSWDKVAEK